MKRLTACLLALGIIAAMVANSADFFFRRPYYEFWDLAANSLAVIRAKHFSELYGSYSRWGFHHPGPAYFYLQAFGEWLFYDLLHLTPAPFNAQTLANLCAMTGFFVAALTVFSRWLSEPARRWFLPGALVLAALHFGAVARIPSFDMLLGSPVFSSPWTAHSWVFPFLCMLAAGASVAAGRGEDLPLLALADGFFVHAHIASPLFVGPITLLAYGGLLATTSRRESPATTGGASPVPRWKRTLGLLGSGWRAFPRRHFVAAAILVVFALPMVIDLFLGDGSNFHAVMVHLRTHHGEHKSFMRSLFYFVQFAAYRPYKAHVHALKRFDAAGAYAYLWFHWRIYAAWIIGILLAVWACAVRPTLIGLGRWSGDDSPTPAAAATSIAPPDRTRFMAWAGAFLLMSIPLTLYWGIIQDGEMFYYSGFCNFAINYFGLLIVLAEGSSALAAWVRRWNNGALLASPAWRWSERLVPAGVVLLVCICHADRFRVRDPSPATNRAMHESFMRVVQDARTRNPAGIKILEFPFFAWPTVTGLALELKRQGQSFMVLDGYSVQFGQAQGWRPTSPVEQHIMELWHIKLGKLFKTWVSGVPKWFVPMGRALEKQLATEKITPGETPFYPLLDDVQLRLGVPEVNLSETGAQLDFRKGGNGPGASLYGFSEPETWGSWNLGTAGVLRLRSEPVDAADDVEIVLDAHPFLAPQAGLLSQRMSVSVNGTPLGPLARLSGDGAVTYVVPGAFWNHTLGQSAGGALEFGFPDAAMPSAVNNGGDTDNRLLGVGFRNIRFQAVRSEARQPALDLDAPDRRMEMNFKPGGNAPVFASGGWCAPEAWGTWSQGHRSKLHFHSRLVEGTHDIEIVLAIRSVMETDSGIKGQRLRASLGGYPIDRERTVEDAGPLVLTVPAAVWNAAVANDADAVLQLDFPDAVSPARLDPGGREQDRRQLAIGFERIDFHDVPAPVVTSR